GDRRRRGHRMEPARITRADATAIIAEARRIVTPDGVERLETVRIGGGGPAGSEPRGRPPQPPPPPPHGRAGARSHAPHPRVRPGGAARRNPALLVLHGGPGYVSMPLSWWFGRGWEEYFTVVHWDQRAAGKTHLLTDPAAVAPTLTLEQMAADAEEVAAWVRA